MLCVCRLGEGALSASAGLEPWKLGNGPEWGPGQLHRLRDLHSHTFPKSDLGPCTEQWQKAPAHRAVSLWELLLTEEIADASPLSIRP